MDRGGFDESLQAGEEIPVLLEMFAQGYLCYSVGHAVLRYHNRTENPARSELVDAFQRGVAATRFDLRQYRDQGELLLSEGIRERFGTGRWKSMKRMLPRVWDENREVSSTDRTLLALLEMASQIGSAFELIRPEPGKLMTLIGRPSGIALVVILRADMTPVIAIVRFDLHARSVRTIVLPEDFQIPAADGKWSALRDRVGKETLSRMTKFDVQDLIGRPLGIEIDESVTIVEPELDGRERRVTGAICDLARGLEPLGDIPFAPAITLLNAFRKSRGADSTLSDVARLLSAWRLRRADTGSQILRLSATGSRLDEFQVEMINAFLDPDSIVRPVTRRSRLKLVEWA